MGSIGRVVADRREPIPYLHIIDPLVNRVRSIAVKVRYHDAVDGRAAHPYVGLVTIDDHLAVDGHPHSTFG